MTKKNILIVDDNPDMVSLLAEMLEVLDVPSQRATDGETALSMMDKQSYSMVITDLKMPKMSGVELLTTIKKNQPDMAVVVISGYRVGTTDSKLVDKLADGFINKPFKMADIQNILDTHL